MFGDTAGPSAPKVPTEELKKGLGGVVSGGEAASSPNFRIADHSGGTPASPNGT